MAKAKPETATPDTTPLTPHDVATDGQAPDDAANSGIAPNTPETLATSLDAAADAVSTNAPSDGSVTMDFGKSGKLTGGLVLNSVPGAVMNFAHGQQVSVVLTLEDGRTTTISVDSAFVK